jgi:hypothetical protein
MENIEMVPWFRIIFPSFITLKEKKERPTLGRGERKIINNNKKKFFLKKKEKKKEREKRKEKKIQLCYSETANSCKVPVIEESFEKKKKKRLKLETLIGT